MAFTTSKNLLVKFTSVSELKKIFLNFFFAKQDLFEQIYIKREIYCEILQFKTFFLF